nr:hypothetical protein [Bacillus fonticola]
MRPDPRTPLPYHVSLLSWEEANKLLPNKSTFTVLDIETGKSFLVQRRAGSQHADVQPVTKKDTNIMKDVYGGEWSWKRRAIIVLSGETWIAASMHGMPHGAGALPNDFPGHFCIHFLGSTTHASHKMDVSHHLMMLKAAHLLDHHFSVSSIEDTAQAWFVAMKNHDRVILTHIMADQDVEKLVTMWEPFQFSRLDTIDLEVEGDLQGRVRISGLFQDNKPFSYYFDVIRFSPGEPYTIVFPFEELTKK